jgi:hypothetical protein
MDTDDAGLESRGDYLHRQHISIILLGLHTLPSGVELAGKGDSSGCMPPAVRVMNSESSITGSCWMLDLNEVVRCFPVILLEENGMRYRGEESTRRHFLIDMASGGCICSMSTTILLPI